MNQQPAGHDANFWRQSVPQKRLIVFAAIVVGVAFWCPWYVSTMSFSGPGGIEHSSDDDSAFENAIVFFRLVSDGAPRDYLVVSALYLPLFLCPLAAVVLLISCVVPDGLSRKKVVALAVTGLLGPLPFLFWHFCGSLFVAREFSPVSFQIAPGAPAASISSFALVLLSAGTTLRRRALLMSAFGILAVAYIILAFAPIA